MEQYGEDFVSISKLIHIGCSYAVGNDAKGFAEDKSLVRHTGKVYTCGNHLADKLGVSFEKNAENGSSNERTFRQLITTNLDNAGILIGITSSHRREGLTTENANSHWHTWKIVPPGAGKKYKNLMFNPWQPEYFPALSEECQIKTILQILYMQSHLKLHNTPYLMFNALHNGFDDPQTDEARRLLDQIDEECFYKLRGRGDESQHGWCVANGMTVHPKDEHPNLQGQSEWGKFLEPQALKIFG